METSSAVRVVSGVASKPIRVDNWGNFLAQRIEALYDKQEHCDLTLRFPHGDLKAHSLVLHACTPFFTNLLKGKTSGPKILKMPPQINSSAMGVILKFVYTGRLEAPFSVDMLYSTAKLLKLQILIRLLEAQMSSVEASTAQHQPGHLVKTSRRGRPPGRFNQPRNSVYQPTNSQLAAKRTVIRAAEPPEDARPSRFELPDSDNLELRLPVLETGLPRPTVAPPALTAASASAAPAATAATATATATATASTSPAAAGVPADREALFEHLRQTPVKRPAPQENGGQKRPKLEPAEDAGRDVTVLREYYEEQRRRAQLLGEEGVTAEDADDPVMEADWQDEELEPAGAAPEAETVSRTVSTPTAVSAASATPAKPASPATPAVKPTVQSTPATPVTPRPILKQDSTPAGGGTSGKKRVQFSESPQLTLMVQDLGDTSELVSQLLKQHPDVLRGGQNVKVRLVTQSSSGSPGRSEYVMVKQQSSQESPQQQQQQQPAVETAPERQSETLDTPLSCSLCAQKGKQADFWWADQMAKHFQDEHSDASVIDLNTLSCTVCVQAGDPIDFATVDDYFTHLRDVHDARGVCGTGSCQLCGFSAPKKLQLIYHQYIKHKIQPPRFITFPKCDRCDFEAISDSEMAQHRQRRHKVIKEYKCKDCGTMFANLSLLEGHMRTNACRQAPDTKRKFEYKCEFCGMSFSRSYNLKGHMRSVHKMSLEMRRVSSQASQSLPAVKQEQSTLVAAPPAPAAAPAVSAPLDPSSEAESMSTVANSVAASLSLAVDGDYMALPDGIVPVEDENGMISYIALRPATDGEPAVSDGAVLEVTQYTVPVVVSSGAGDSVSIQVEQVSDAAPGASAGEMVLPDLPPPRQPAPARQLTTQSIDLPRTTAPQIARTLVSVPQLQTTASSATPAGRRSSGDGTPRGEWRERRRPAGTAASSRISVSSSEITVSDMAESGPILSQLPDGRLPAAVSQPGAVGLHYGGQTVSLAELQHGQLVMSDGLTAGHVIVSELPAGQEVIVADMAHGQLYEVHQQVNLQQRQEMITADAAIQHGHQIEVDTIGQQQQTEMATIHHRQIEQSEMSHQTISVSQSQFISVTQPQNISLSQPQNIEVSQPQSIGVSQSQDVSVSQPQSIGVSQPQNIGVSQPHDINLLQPQAIDIPQSQSISVPQMQDNVLQPQDANMLQPHDICVSQPQDIVMSHLQNVSVSQPQNVSVSQAHDTSMSQIQDIIVSQPQHTSMSQPHDTGMSQPQDTSMSQPQDTGMSQPQDTSMSQPQDTSMSQPQDTSMPQPQHTSMSQPQDTSMSQPQDTSMSQLQDTSMSQPQHTIMSQPQDTSISQPQDTNMFQPQDTSMSQLQDTSISQPQNISIPQSQDTSTAQLQNTSISQPQDTSIPQPQDTSVSQPLDTSIPQPPDTSVSEPQNISISQASDTGIPQPSEAGILQADVSVSQAQDASVLQTEDVDASQPQGVGATALQEEQNGDFVDPQGREVGTEAVEREGAGESSAHHTQDVSMSDVSGPEKFVEPDTRSGTDVDTHDMQNDQEVCKGDRQVEQVDDSDAKNVEVGESVLRSVQKPRISDLQHDQETSSSGAGHCRTAGPTEAQDDAADQSDVSAANIEHNPDVSRTAVGLPDLSMSSDVSDAARRAPAEGAVDGDDSPAANMDTSVAHYPPGGGAAVEAAGEDGSLVLVLEDEAEEGRSGPAQEQAAVTSAAPPHQLESPASPDAPPDRPAGPTEVAPDPGDTWDEVMPPDAGDGGDT